MQRAFKALVGIERSRRPIAAARIARSARLLLDASTLCAIATVAPRGRAYISTAYFAWTPELHVVWLSEPRARHSRNIRANPAVAVAVYDSTQTWGRPDRGIQLFGTAREVEPSAAGVFEASYARRFSEYSSLGARAYRFYVLSPLRLKLFDEQEFGEGVFVTARVSRDGRTRWERTDVYRSDA
jgi:uncharacterized protein YhbP (UPF0306 family)